MSVHFPSRTGLSFSLFPPNVFLLFLCLFLPSLSTPVSTWSIRALPLLLPLLYFYYRKMHILNRFLSSSSDLFFLTKLNYSNRLDSPEAAADPPSLLGPVYGDRRLQLMVRRRAADALMTKALSSIPRQQSSVNIDANPSTRFHVSNPGQGKSHREAQRHGKSSQYGLMRRVIRPHCNL
jgi:hypothetical protein